MKWTETLHGDFTCEMGYVLVRQTAFVYRDYDRFGVYETFEDGIGAKGNVQFVGNLDECKNWVKHELRRIADSPC